MKNSWGDTWGQEGYILLERSDSEEDDGGECGLLIEATYPILEPIHAPDAADEASYKMMGLEAMERPMGFESSATANDCGGGTSDVVFDDGEEEGAGGAEGPREKGGDCLFRWDWGAESSGRSLVGDVLQSM